MIPSRCVRQRPILRFFVPKTYSRFYHATSARWNITGKYLEKVQRLAEQQGISVDDLKKKVKESTRSAPLPEARFLQEHTKEPVRATKADGVWIQNERKDKSPVKPLSDIMDIHKVLRTPHSAEQIVALWTAFHASRSGGTGRGHLSASVPLHTYEQLLETGKKYPTFILPLIREASSAKFSDADESNSEKREAATGYEFFFMQWAFHPASPFPSPSILDESLPENAVPPAPVHPLATVLFTPLLEYKTHQAFATPHLVLTMYPDLAQSHRLVLMRGELTPSPVSNDKYLLSQQDAQLLVLGLQRFYLTQPGGEQKDEVPGAKERAELLKTFNENPSEFLWEELLKHANPTS